MRNKALIGAVLIVLISAVILGWYTGETSISITSLEMPVEAGTPDSGYHVGTYDSGFLYITLLNNGTKDVNVTLSVKNTLEDEKGNSIQSYIVVYGQDIEPYTIDEPRAEIKLKPGRNELRAFFGYQAPGLKKIEVEVNKMGRLVDAKAVEVTVLPPVIGVSLQYTNESKAGYDIYRVFGSLSNTGKGSAQGVEVNISILNEATNTIVSSAAKKYYTIRSNESSYPMSIWEGGYIVETPGPVAVIELSSGSPSNESYILASTVARGKTGDRFKVIVTARWHDQVVKAEMMVPPRI